MSHWKQKCGRLSNKLKKQHHELTIIMNRFSTQVGYIYTASNQLSEESARAFYPRLASLTDQLEKLIPTLNRIARTKYEVN